MADTKSSAPVKASTQIFIEIADIQDDIAVMRDNSASIVIEVGAANFWLLSEDEQMATVAAYGNLLNSLSFPVQILILSKKIDVSAYLDYLSQKHAHQTNAVLKTRLTSYIEYIKNTVKKNSVLERRFFFVVPFSNVELGLDKMASKKLSMQYVVDRAKTSLYPKRDNLLRLLAKMGLRATVLGKQALTELYYNLYNPSATGRKLSKVENYMEVVQTGA